MAYFTLKKRKIYILILTSMYFKSYFSTFVGVVKHMKTHIVLKNAINQKKKKTLKTMKKGKDYGEGVFNFFLVNHCDAVYIV